MVTVGERSEGLSPRGLEEEEGVASMDDDRWVLTLRTVALLLCTGKGNAGVEGGLIG